MHDQYSSEHITQEHLIFLSALAIDENAPNVAIELLQQLWPTAHPAIPSLRLNALLHMRKFLESIQMLRSILVVFDNNRSQKDEVIAVDVVSKHTSTQKTSTDFVEADRVIHSIFFLILFGFYRLMKPNKYSINFAMTNDYKTNFHI